MTALVADDTVVVRNGIVVEVTLRGIDLDGLECPTSLTIKRQGENRFQISIMAPARKEKKRAGTLPEVLAGLVPEVRTHCEAIFRAPSTSKESLRNAGFHGCIRHDPQ